VEKRGALKRGSRWGFADIRATGGQARTASAGERVEIWAILQSLPEFMGRILMRIFIVLFVAAFSASSLAAQGTGPASGTTPSAAPEPAPALAAPAVAAPSHILQPSFDTVQQTLTGLKIDRWKRGSVRDEASADINSIQQDMRLHVPGLLQDADAAPGTLSKALPLSRHVDALYDVLLRVVEAARIAAPDDQANELRQTLATLNKARLALDDSMETAAGAQEKQMADLRVTVQKQAAFKCPAPPPAPECPKPAVKKPAKKKPAPATPAKAPAATTPGATPQAAPQKPAAGKPSGAAPQKPPTTGP
jgi:hypothetical protein